MLQAGRINYFVIPIRTIAEKHLHNASKTYEIWHHLTESHPGAF